MNESLALQGFLYFMRLWSLHPKYLDAKGLVALWRETLLAKKVLENKTKGYRNHPQLIRFKNCGQPLRAINYYLSIIHDEATARGYLFDKSKINRRFEVVELTVTRGQIDYETTHLKNKLETRDKGKFQEVRLIKIFDAHPLFRVIEGNVEEWEIVAQR